MGFFDKFKKAAPPPPREKSPLEERLAPLYPRLVRQIAAMTPVEWDVLYFLGEVEPEEASYSSVFYIQETRSGNYVRSSNFPRVYGISKEAYLEQWKKLNDILLEIYHCFLEGGHKPWEQLSMSLERTGKFNVHFNYDAVHATSADQPAREVLWAHETFGYTPAEGSWMRRLLDEQLQGGGKD